MKKRLLSIILCLCMVLSLMPISMTAFAESNVLYGDADTNGTVDLQDILLMEKHIAGEQVVINETNADVNADGLIDEEDVLLVREFLAGNLTSLTPDLCTLTFNTNGGNIIQDISVGRGYSVYLDIPTPTKDGHIFTEWIKGDGSPFYKDDIVTHDIALTANYAPIESNENLKITSFALLEQSANLSFRVLGGKSVEEVWTNVSVIPKDGSDPVEIDVKGAGDGVFVVSAKHGFAAGASYELTLNGGLTFEGKGDEINTVNFVIKKEQNDNLYYNEDLEFLKDTDKINYTVGGDTFEMLEISLFRNDEQTNIVGTFNYQTGSFSAGDFVCVYEEVDPRQRDYSKNDYQDDRLAYIKITSEEAGLFSFISLDSDEASNILRMPDSIPFRVETLPENNGAVNKDDYDGEARGQLGFTKAPTYQEGDFLVFYTEKFTEASNDTPVRYAQVTGVDGELVQFKLVTKDAIDSYMGIFVSKDVDSDDVVNDLDPEFLRNVEMQAENSGFVDAAKEHMVQTALQTDSLKSELIKNGVTQEEISRLMASNLSARANGGEDNGLELKVESVKVSASLISGKESYFDNGIGIGLDIRVVLSLEKKVSETTINSLKIDLTASFLQEIAVSVNVNVEDKWTWYFFVPVLKELSCYTNVDIKSYSFVSVSARLYSVSKELNVGWETVTSKLADPQLQKALKEINKLGVLLKKNKDKIEKVPEYIEKLKELKKKLPSVNINGKETSFEDAEKQLGMSDISSEFQEVLDADNESKSKIGVDKLVDKYADMLNQESQWITLFEKTLFEKEIHIKVVAIKIKVDFNVTANVNISLGAEVEYQTGKRFNFWVHVFERKCGSNEMDLIDEKFGFQFYVMGSLGLKIGIKAEIAVGVISTKIASIGANVEFGPYLKLYGYFFYTYTKVRPANTSVWEESEEKIGALYLDFGLYLIVNFKAQAFDDTFKYEPTLFDKEISLLTVGVRHNVYGFANKLGKNDVLKIVDNDDIFSNGINMNLPSSYLQMKVLDLVNGGKSQNIYDNGKFFYRFSNRNFSMGDNGLIKADLSSDTRYITCDLTITWKSDKLAFSKYDMTITVPMVWTNLSEEELNETFVASIAVGNIYDGYTIITSTRYSRKESFNLPSKEEILALINYDSYNSNGANLKYSEIKGYNTENTEEITLSVDTTFYFDVNLREYTISVNGVQREDGSTEKRTYTSAYKELFDFSDLHATGANDAVNGQYTSFLNLTELDDKSKVFNIDDTVDRNFYEKYGFDTEINAEYANDALTATYDFIGIDAPVVEVTFKKGNTPYFEGLDEYVIQHGGKSAFVSAIDPIVASVEQSVNYTVSCKLNEADIPKYSIHFNTNGGSKINSAQYFKGSSIREVPPPTYTGRTFKGWFRDSNFTQQFAFNELMPGADITVYAKWDVNKYTVTLTSDSNTIGDLIVTYGNVYGKLKDPEKKTDFKFIGWYTDKAGGEKITSDTLFTGTSNLTLYARWQQKAVIDTADITYSPSQTHTYDKSKKDFVFNVSEKHPGVTGFVVNYKLVGGSPWSSIVPIDAGSYDVKIDRPGDEDFMAMKEIVISTGLIINKATPTVKKKDAFIHAGVVRCPPPETDSDGKIKYKLSSDNYSLALLYENYTGFFHNLERANYKYSFIIEESKNYKSIQSDDIILNVPGRVRGIYTVNLTIKTGNSTWAGTSNDVFGGVHFKSTKRIDIPIGIDDDFKWVMLDGPGFDFQKNSVQTYTVAAGFDPWNLAYIHIAKPRVIAGNDDWHFESLRVSAGFDGKLFYADTFMVDNRDFRKKDFDVSTQTAFKRTISNMDSFYAGGGDTLDLTQSGSNYGYGFTGFIKDQFYPSGYNCFDHSLAPEFSVTANNKAYDKFIVYSSISGFYVDTIGLTKYINENGGQDFKYTISLRFDSTTVNGTNVFRKEVSVKVPKTAKKTLKSQAVDYQGLAGRNFNTMPANAQFIADSVSDNSPLVISSDLIMTLKGKTIEVPFYLDSDTDFWGVLGSVDYDKSLFELIGHTTGDLYDESDFTLCDDLSSMPYKFLATAKNLSDISAGGTLIKLKFKVKEDARDQSSVIKLNLLQGINVQGDILEIDTTNGAVIIDSTAPVISGVVDGKTYYGPQTVTVKETNLDEVTVNGKKVALDNETFILSPSNDEQIIMAVDLAGNETVVTVKVLEKNREITKTGDSTNILIWFVLVVASGLIMLMAIKVGKHKKRSGKKF